MLDDIISYREMCAAEEVNSLQRGMNFHLNGKNYSVVLMSMKSNAPYVDKILDDGITIEYEGHDEPKTASAPNPKIINQSLQTRLGKLNENGKFAEAVKNFKSHQKQVAKVKVYEKISTGIWSLKGFFDLIDFKKIHDGKRYVYVFVLKLSMEQMGASNQQTIIDIKHTRLIPSQIKKEVYKRDAGKCVLCGNGKNLHYDHDLPFAKGGSSLTAVNIRLLCATCNLKKSDKIE